MIHPTAVIHPTARIGKGVTVGPYAVVDQGVVIGDECHIGPHVHLTGVTKIGKMNRFHSGAVIGDAPQDLKYNDEPTGLVIGNENVFREHVTVHRSNKSEENTIIGSGCLFMAGSHVGHNSSVGDQVIVANGALLGGHVTVHDRAFLSGNCLVHQFVTVGTLALMQGGAAVSKDVPPYCIAAGDNGISGLNSVGLRRSGMPIAERNELRRVYHKLFLRTNRVAEVLGSIDDELEFEASRLLVDFVRLSKRGVCAHAKRA